MTDMQQVKVFLLELADYISGIPDTRDRIAAWEPGLVPEETYEPFSAFSGRYHWYDNDRGGYRSGTHPESDLPRELFRRLRGGEFEDGYLAYPTRETAMTALAAAKTRRPG